MSLTAFIDRKESKAKLKEVFKKPKFSPIGQILAKPLTKNYGQIGTAFDYMLRFYINSRNDNVVEREWVSEYSLVGLKKNTKQHKQADKLINQAKERYVQYKKDRILTNELIESSIHLAKLDLIYRIGYLDENIEKINALDVQDLTNLCEVIDPNIFTNCSLCVLNPTFPKAGELLMGADCDVFLDGILLDIKTSKYLTFKRDYFNQLIGYFLLASDGGITGLDNTEISHLGVYFSRYSILRMFPTSSITENPKFEETKNWFFESIDEWIWNSLSKGKFTRIK